MRGRPLPRVSMRARWASTTSAARRRWRSAAGSREAARPVGRRLPQDRVLRALLRRLGPRLDLAVPRLTVLAQRVQEGRRAARPLLGGAPPVAGAQQQRPRPGEGHIAQPELLGPLMPLHGVLEGRDPLAVPGGDVRQGPRVPAQLMRQDPRVRRPGLAGLFARELLGHQPRHRHHIPLQPLGLVGGEHLEPRSRRRGGRCRAPSRTARRCAESRRKPCRVASPSTAAPPSRPAKAAATSRKLPSVSRRRAARACGEADSSTSRPVVARTRWSTSISGSARVPWRSSRSSAASRANRIRASAEKGSPSSGPPPASRKVSSASAREITSEGSVPSTASASRRSGSSAAPSGPPWETSARAWWPSSARGRGGRSASAAR
ncbi:hypothetical protein SANTM175S_05726 [Streptomyces antimycoticus]